MSFEYWPVLPIGAVLAVVAILSVRRRGRAKGVPTANMARLTALPGFSRLQRRYSAILAGAMTVALLAAAAALILAARPVERTIIQPDEHSRDVVLCLDVSMSMARADAALVAKYEKLAHHFDGERIGLVAFDSSAVQVFPLTNDYTFVSRQLRSVEKSLAGGEGTSAYAGTSTGNGTSIIGDGLATCVNSFGARDDDRSDDRSRTIVLATDNGLAGRPIFTLQQAAKMAAKKDIVVEAINPYDFAGPEGKKLQAAAESTSGHYYSIDDASAVDGIVADVQARAAAAITTGPQLRITDQPAIFAIAAALCVFIVLATLWRARL